VPGSFCSSSIIKFDLLDLLNLKVGGRGLVVEMHVNQAYTFKKNRKHMEVSYGPQRSVTKLRY